MSELGSQSVYLAFVAGLLSVLSPCVLPLMPAYLSMVSGISVEEMQESADRGELRRRVLAACLSFVCGFSTVFVVLGVGAVAAGRMLRTWRAELLGLEFGVAQIAGLVVVLLGLHMTGLFRIRALYRDTRVQLPVRHGSAMSAFLIGAAFAFGWSPCIGPILATILTVAGSKETVLEGVALLSIYSAGLAVPFLLAGLSIEYFFEAFDRLKIHFRKLEIVCGAIIVGVGLLVLTDQLSVLNRKFQFLAHWLAAAEASLQ